ncbi:MAG TPA: glucosamine-6-phosphate deaminase [Tessaracoccus flavescens]|uniref:Glucosamine-6-phosphate deaminase n=1 Tax=Tessaracoccus flavescens TaxID=399497 RepID=A0A921EMX8_9ACTN|nr:glucosamine-6-phosphate deaminase [Tessaracoccus flavescens]
MDVVICRDAAEVGRVAADRVIEHLEGITTPVIGLATGSSPLSLYAELAQRAKDGTFSFEHGVGFALDEYVGIDIAHPESYRSVINRTVVEPFGMEAGRVNVPDGLADDLDAAAAAYDDSIDEAGGVDVQILGIGSNGHIGFNEPFTSFSSRTHIVKLTDQTREDNARFFNSLDEVPTHAATQGLGTIMDSRCAVMVATGEGKADAIKAMIEGPVAIRCPASILQFHPNVIVVIDEAAASKLEYPHL